MKIDSNGPGRPERHARGYRSSHFASVVRPCEEREYFCQLRPGTKRVLQQRAYLAGALLLAGSLGAPGASGG